MKENEEEKLNEVEESNDNEDIEMVELSEDDENEVEGGGTGRSCWSYWSLPGIIPEIPNAIEQNLAIKFENGQIFVFQNENHEIDGWKIRGTVVYRKNTASSRSCTIGRVAKLRFEKQTKFYAAYYINGDGGVRKITNVPEVI